MPSPFPGMNPYLENSSVFHDFHERFMPIASDFIVPQIRPEFFVKLDQQVYIHELAREERSFIGRPDMYLAGHRAVLEMKPSVAILEAPVEAILPLTTDFEHNTFLEIRNRDDQSLVTVMELLSPTNKYAGPDREQFLSKRRHILSSGVNYVEIDLLRGGPRLPIKELPECDYYVMVSRWEKGLKTGVWPLKVTDRLPVIPIPLRPPHQDAKLDLQAILDRIYDNAGYEDHIYNYLPEPKLHSKDEAWAQQFVPKRNNS